MTATCAKLQLLLTIFANIGSIYLGYILRYVLNDMCVVCISMYVVNFVILVLNFLSINNFTKRHEKAAPSGATQRKLRKDKWSLMLACGLLVTCSSHNSATVWIYSGILPWELLALMNKWHAIVYLPLD